MSVKEHDEQDGMYTRTRATISYNDPPSEVKEFIKAYNEARHWPSVLNRAEEHAHAVLAHYNLSPVDLNPREARVAAPSQARDAWEMIHSIDAMRRQGIDAEKAYPERMAAFDLGRLVERCHARLVERIVLAERNRQKGRKEKSGPESAKRKLRKSAKWRNRALDLYAQGLGRSRIVAELQRKGCKFDRSTIYRWLRK